MSFYRLLTGISPALFKTMDDDSCDIPGRIGMCRETVSERHSEVYDHTGKGCINQLHDTGASNWGGGGENTVLKFACDCCAFSFKNN